MVRTQRGDSDFFILTIAGLLLCAEITYMLGMMRVIDLPLGYMPQDRKQPVLGIVLQKTLSVRGRAFSSLSWLPVASGDSVHEKDTLMTGSASAAVVQLNDGTRVELGPNALLHFSESPSQKDTLDLELKYGTAKVEGGQKTKQIRLKKEIVSLPAASKSKIESQALSAKTRVEVEVGRAIIESDEPGKEKIVESGQAVQITQSGEIQLEKVETLPIPTPIPEPIKVEPEKPVSYSLTSPSRLFLRRTAPATFKWEAIEGAQKYKVEISKDAEFKNILHTSETAELRFSWRPESSGKYFWRIEALSDKRTFPKSLGQQIRIKFPASAPKVREGKILPTKPSAHQKPKTGFLQKRPWFLAFVSTWISVAYAEEAEEEKIELELSWEAVPEARQYRLQVSKDKNFQEILVDQRTSETELVVELVLTKEYFWRVAAVDKEGDLGHFSEKQRMSAEEVIARAERAKAERLRAEKEQAEEAKRQQIIAQEEAARLKAEQARMNRPLQISRLAVAYGGDWAVQRGSSSLSSIQASGVALNSIRANTLLEQGRYSLNILFAYQPWRYRSENPNLGTIQPGLSVDRWDLSLLARKMRSDYYGLRIRREGELQQTGPETVFLGTLSYFAAVYGLRAKWGDWSGRAQIELAPIGPRKGVSLQGSVYYRFPFSQALFKHNVDLVWELSLYPYYRNNSINGHPEWTAEAGTWLWLTWNIGSPA